jgi:hypothetical protein
VRCLGNQVFGLIYSAQGMRLYRERADGKFSEWSFGDVEADHGIPVLPPNGPVGAIAGVLDDGRLLFVVHPAGGVDAQLVAIVLGASDEPALFSLELPGSPLITAAALPARSFGDTLWLAWTDAATRGTTLSHWLLPLR